MVPVEVLSFGKLYVGVWHSIDLELFVPIKAAGYRIAGVIEI